MSARTVPLAVHAGVFAALLALTWITVLVSGLDLGPWNTAAALGIASLKGSLVVLYFMHLRWSPRLLWIFAGVALFFLTLLITLTLSDFMTRNRVRIYGPSAVEVDEPAH